MSFYTFSRGFASKKACKKKNTQKQLIFALHSDIINSGKGGFSVLLTIDAGNTNLTVGTFRLKTGDEPDELLFHARLATDRSQTADQLAIALWQLFRLYGQDPKACAGTVIGSVVSEMTPALQEAAVTLTGREALVLAPGIKTGLNIRIDDPAQLGADLIASAVGAKALYPLPCIVVDLGTATKLSAVDLRGDFRGAVICAGVQISQDALSTRTSLLPHIALQPPAHCIGTNSVESMQSGMVFGTACMIDGMLRRMEQELGTPAATVIATGGLAKEIVRHCAREIAYNADLVLLGLKEIYRKNRLR
jgi:type III pantothenate kinase